MNYVPHVVCVVLIVVNVILWYANEGLLRMNWELIEQNERLACGFAEAMSLADGPCVHESGVNPQEMPPDREL